MSKESGVSGGIGFMGVLSLLFIGLKLGDVIDWSWIWVLAPLWLPGASILAICVLVLIAALITHILHESSR
jgi:hypothetical protein